SIINPPWIACALKVVTGSLVVRRWPRAASLEQSNSSVTRSAHFTRAALEQGQPTTGPPRSAVPTLDFGVTIGTSAAPPLVTGDCPKPRPVIQFSQCAVAETDGCLTRR